jgi:hypothetical protein
MYIYVLHSVLFGSPRIITTNWPVKNEVVELLANYDNDYLPPNQWKIIELPWYPVRNVE